MTPQCDRRRFLQSVAVATLAGGSGSWQAVARAAEDAAASGSTRPAGRRVFLAELMHETNTFHPLRTTRFDYHPPQAGELPTLAAWANSGLTIVPGVGAEPDGGGTVAEQPCREAMARIVKSLAAAMPVDGVFLRLHGAMFAEGVGPAETVLVEEVRRLVGPRVTIACTFDLHGNIPARLAKAGDILVGFKTAPHIDKQETAEHAGRLLLARCAARSSRSRMRFRFRSSCKAKRP